MTQRIVLASGNAGKIRELQHSIGDKGYTVVAQSEFNTPEIEETGLSFVENAILKARNACQHANLPAIADDSGLEVDALRGQPGIYSARFAGPEASDADNNQQLLERLADIPEQERTARFQCSLIYMRHAEDPTPLIAQGSWEGRILFTPRGDNGFGYDPLFFVPQYNCSSAELPPGVKNSISHRGQAMKQLLVHFSSQYRPINGPLGS